MLDDIIEAVIDIAGGILEAVISSRRSKSSKSKQAKATPSGEPWTRRDRTAPWET